jgi:hypothetical protein
MLEHFVDVRALSMVVRCPLVSHHIDEETANYQGIFLISLSAFGSR